MKKVNKYEKLGRRIGILAGALVILLIYLIGVFGLVWLLKHLLVSIF